MFDIKYVMNKAKTSSDGAYDGTIKNERYNYLNAFDNVWIYENDRVLPLGYMVSEDIKKWQTTDSMPFDVQNDFIKQAAGIDEKMFTNVPLSSFDYTYMNITDPINDNEYKYELTDPANLSLHPTVTSKIISDKDQYIYLYVDAGNTKNVTYITDTANEQRELSAGKSLFDIGQVKAGEEITVKFELTNKGEFEHTYRKDGTVKIYAASYDDAVFQKAYDKLKSQPFEVTSFKDTEITGNITAERDGVMLTSIPYVPGWKVSVDGKQVKKVSVGNDGLIGVDLTKGSHSITFKYSPSGFVPGIFITVISIICTAAYTMFFGKKKKKKFKTAEIAA